MADVDDHPWSRRLAHREFLGPPKRQFLRNRQPTEGIAFGEEVSAIGVAVARGWQWFSVAISVLVMAYLIDAAVQTWLKGESGSRRKALTITFGITVPLLATIAYSSFLVFGVIQAPVSNVPWLLGALVLMAFEMGREFIVSGRARLELAELRSSLARVERASVQGQLASALAHELSQPLHAISLNVAVAGKHLKADEPDIEELQAIFHDIDGDDRRAADIIDRLRKLFPQHRVIETQPISVEDVLADVAALVRAEAASKHVAVDLVVPHELPRVLADRVHLSQVLLNLVSNGIHAVEFGARSTSRHSRRRSARRRDERRSRDRRPRFRARNSRRSRRQHLHAVLFDKAGRRGHRVGALPLASSRPKVVACGRMIRPRKRGRYFVWRCGGCRRTHPRLSATLAPLQVRQAQRSVSERHGEAKRSPAVGMVLGGNPTAVFVDDRARHRETEAHAAAFGGEERIEDEGEDFAA